LSLGLVFVTVALGRWLLVFAGVVFAAVAFSGGGGSSALSSLSKYSRVAAPGPPFATARAARVPGLQPTPSSAIAREEAAETVGLRLPSMSTTTCFAGSYCNMARSQPIELELRQELIVYSHLG
jgi:hypothetical protein